MDVNWSELTACAGHSSASGIPSAVVALFSDSIDERRKAYWKIDNHAVVQGDLYESAPYAARLIVDLLKANPSCLNRECLDLLFELANGSAGGALVEHGPLAGQSIKKLCDDAVLEVLPIVANSRDRMGEIEQRTIDDLLEVYQSRGMVATRPRSQPGC